MSTRNATGSRGSDGWLRIAEVAHEVGIPAPTIRSWERRYGFPDPDRTGGAHRRYSPDNVEQLRAVRDRITRGERPRDAIEAVQRSGVAADPRLATFATAVDALALDDARGVLEAAEVALGVERAVTEIALPGMRAVGARWREGTIDIAVEHAATEVVRRWLAVHDTTAGAPGPPAVVLACCAGEHHTIGLEAFSVVLHRRGLATLVLGGDVPAASIATAAGASRIRVAVVVAHRTTARRAAIRALEAVEQLPGVTPAYAGNAFTSARARGGVPGVYLGEDVVAAAGRLDELVTRR